MLKMTAMIYGIRITWIPGKDIQGFLLKKDNENLMLREGMRVIIKNPAFVEQMGDAIEYRMTDYYRRRYKEKCNIDESKIL